LEPQGKRDTARAVKVTLPPQAFDKSLARDGVVEKPEDRTGMRQWWLQQIVAAVPPTHWSDAWAITPEECVAAVKGEFGPIVLRAWNEAASRHPEEQWVRALVLAARAG